MKKRLCKVEKGKVICGVCTGLGEYFNIDPILIRLIWVIAILFWGTGLLLYIIAALIIPNEY